MRRLQINKSGLNKLRSHHRELKSSDFEDSIRSVPPGEWCTLQGPGTGDEAWVAYLNPMIEDKFSCAQIVTSIKPREVDSFEPEKFIEATLAEALRRRRRFKNYLEGSRLFYGFSDGLPGLIIDSFQNGSIIQINTAGIDKHRSHIQSIVSKLTDKPAYFLDNPKYREKESLPTHASEKIPSLVIVENGLTYSIRSEVMQKVGFYYDHRENRLQLQQLLRRLQQVPKTAVDLFSYVGAWGLNALAAGVERVDFVDQGDLAIDVEVSLSGNGFAGRGRFHRLDVFKFLDEAIAAKKNYDLILCDPPAFAKSVLQKAQALDGYSKLHRKVLKVAAPGSICAFSSCTHYIGHDEFQKNVLDAAYKEGRSIQLLYSGMQGWDHPVKSLDDKANYIKSYFYIVE